MFYTNWRLFIIIYRFCNRSRHYIWSHDVPMYTICSVPDLPKIPTDAIYSLMELLVHYIWVDPVNGYQILMCQLFFKISGLWVCRRHYRKPFLGDCVFLSINLYMIIGVNPPGILEYFRRHGCRLLQ
jgi:hypothetical protein